MNKMQHLTSKNILPSRRIRPVILAFLLVSGSCGLIYEIVWMKMLTLVIGNTVFSITAVLASFMGGLALGSVLAGRLIDKIKDPLRTYGVLEGAIGAYALLLPVLLAGTEPLFRFIYQNIDPSFYTFSLLRFLVCGIILLVPTTLMGATLPVLSKYFVDRRGHLGWNVGLLYGVNTSGAVLGSFAAGFVLIPILGITWTIYGAALLNLSIAGGVWMLARKSQGEPSGSAAKLKSEKRERERAEEVLPVSSSTVILVVMVGIGLSGVAAMMYQIAWTRVLSLSIGSSVYAFSLIVTAFICGLALGSLLIATVIDKRRDLVLGLALMEGAIGVSALLIVPLLGKLPIFLADAVLDSSNSFQYIHFAEFAIIFALILIPTCLMGAAVPMAVKICATDVTRVGRSFGNVYAVNTLGAIIGSFVAGFLLIPWLGTQNSLLIAVATNIFAAGLILLQAPSLSVPRRVAGSLVMAVLPVLVWNPVYQWDAAILTSGPYLYAETYRDTSAQQGIGLEEAVKKGRELLFFKEGLHAVVSVQKTSEGDLMLNLNGKTDASARGGDAATQLMLGHLPLLLHQGAEDVLVIGLGSGMTLGAVERYPVQGVDVVEIEAAVVEASEYFQEFTGDVLHDPRVNLIVADGRNHLALTRRSYDVIISEPSNPWISGMANLFTQEFFELANARLRPEGVMCQWVHAYSMSSVDFKTIVRTFHAVFPHTSIWEATLGGDYLLIGSQHDVPIDHQMLIDRLNDERLRADLETMNLRDLAAFVNKLVMTGDAIAQYTDGAPLHTDDNARLEYSAPKALLQGQSTELLTELYRYGATPVKMLRSLGWVDIAAQIEKDSPGMFQAKQEVLAGYISLTKGAAQDAITKFENALAIRPQDYAATYLLAELTYRKGHLLKDAQRLAEATRAYQKSLETIENFISSDRASLSDHFDLEVIYVMAQLDLGIMALKAGRLTAAAQAFERSVSGEVQFAIAYNNLGLVYGRTGKYDAALNQFQRAIELKPNLVSARMNLGDTLLRQKHYAEAIESYRQVQKLRPDFALTHYNLGRAYFEQNQWVKAEKEWKRALELNANFTQAQRSLGVVWEKMKR